MASSSCENLLFCLFIAFSTNSTKAKLCYYPLSTVDCLLESLVRMGSGLSQNVRLVKDSVA